METRSASEGFFNQQHLPNSMNEYSPSGDLPIAELITPSTAPDTQSPLVELFCWGLIVAICGLTFASQWMVQNSEPEKSDQPASELAEVRSVGFMTRILIAQKNLAGGSADVIVGNLNQGTLWQRYAAAIEVGELSGPAGALAFLGEVDAAVQESNYQPDDRQIAVRQSLENIFNVRELTAPGEIATFDPRDSDVLTSEFDWLGTLALNPIPQNREMVRPGIDDRSNRLIYILIGVGMVGILMFLASAICLPLAVVQFFRGRFRSAMPDQTFSGSIYLEMFACWLVLTVIIVPAIFATLGLAGKEDLNESILVLGPISQLLPVAGALIWPMLRGKSLAGMMQELGLTAKNPLAEIGAGIFGYLCAIIPLVILLAVVSVTMFLGGSVDTTRLDSAPAIHPVQNLLMSGDLSMILFVLVVACILAPIVEEIVFRGALYRYLRDRTGNYSRWTSVTVSILVAGILFAAIHPQNLVGLIPLTSLAVAMAMMRQWRSSLVASMTFHALNNGVVMMTMLLIYL